MASVSGPPGQRENRNTRSARPRRRPPAWLAAAVAAASVAIGCAACSSPGSSPGGTGNGPASGPAARLLEYSRCMQAHGIKDYPDPDSNGSMNIGASAQAGSSNSSDLNPDNPAYQAAQRACRSLQPGGTQSGGQLAQNVAAGVQLAACMRSHGFPAFPDPTGQNVFNIPAGIDMNSAAYESAISTCQSKAKDHGARYSQNLGGPGGS